jgi:transposase
MLVVETIARIRRDYFVKKKPIKEIVRDVKVSRNTVRKVIRTEATSFSYDRRVQPMPKLGPWRDELDRVLAANEAKGKRERLSLLRISEDLEALGYSGGYDAVRRYAKTWRRRRSTSLAQAYIPLTFSPGEAYQFDWSHEYVVLAGVTTKVKVAHVRLCHSRMFFVRAYPRESQEMVFDAHDRAFRLFDGACRRGIYDNMKTAVETVFIGKDRVYNRRFLQMCGHYLVEPTACTPGAGWEKGQVENQVGTVRGRFFTPRLRFKTYDELNAWLLDQCVAYARRHPHPTFKDKTVWQIFEDERPSLVAMRSRRRCRRPAWCASTATSTAWRHAPSAGRSRCTPMPSASLSARTARLLPSMPGASGVTRPSTIRGTTYPCSPGSPARCATARHSRTGRCPAPWVVCAPGLRATTTATGRWSRSSPPCQRTGWWRLISPVPRRSPAGCVAPMLYSTSSIAGASLPLRYRSRRRRACAFALSRWPTAPVTIA